MRKLQLSTSQFLLLDFLLRGIFFSLLFPVTMRMVKCTGTACATLMLLCAVAMSPAGAAHAVYPRIRLSHKGRTPPAAGDAAAATRRRWQSLGRCDGTKGGENLRGADRSQREKETVSDVNDFKISI